MCILSVILYGRYKIDGPTGYGLKKLRFRGDPLTLPHWDGYGQDPLARLLEPRRVAIRYGEAICLRSAAGRCVDVEGLKVSARWFDRGAWQSFVLCPTAGGRPAPGAPLREGDHVRLLAHTGACVALTPHGKAGR